MATRRERVVLDLEDNFSAGMVKAASAAALLDKNLNSLSGSAVSTRKSVSDLNSSDGVPALGRNADSSGKQIDKLSGRLALFAQAAAALGPALAPIGAAVVPALAGMTLQLGLAAGAAGVTMLAFNGIGDGLKALNAYQLKPSAENFAKLNEALDKLGPAGQEFVLSLDKMMPKFQEIRSMAEAGLLPGVTDSLDKLMTIMPQAQGVVFNFASTLGDLVSSGADSLTGAGWVDFFDYINVTARPVLTEMGQTLGNFIEGISNMVMAFDPLSRSFSTGFADMARSFNEWSQSLSGSQGFTDFVDYVQKSGPMAMDAIGSIANALIQLVEAAAPIGQAVLPVITALADAFSAVADSSVGPALIATAAGVSVLSRSMALLGTTSKGLTGGGVLGAIGAPDKIRASTAALREVTSATTELQIAEMQRARAAKTAASAQFGLMPAASKRGAVTEYMAASEKAAKASERLAAAEKNRSAAVRAGAAQFGKTAGLVGGLALATSGLADKTGLANTTSMALMGTIAGPWGAAIGGGVGLVMDLAGANNDLEDAMKAVDQAASGFTPNFAGLGVALDGLGAKSEDSGKKLQDAWSFSGDASIKNSLAGFTSISDLWTNSTEKSTEAARKHRDELMAMGSTLTALSAKTGGDLQFGASVEELDSYANKIAPALQAAGLSFKDIQGNTGLAAAAIHDYAMSMDTATGKSEAVGAAMAELGSEIETNVTQADALKAALDSLFGVELNQSAATDAATVALKEMRKAVGDVTGDLLGNGDAALKARDSMRGYVEAQLTKVQADAAADGNGRRAAQTLLNTRDNLVATAKAAGLGKTAIANLTAEMGMTPKNLVTIIQQPGMLNAKQQIKALGQIYGLTPQQIQTFISQPGMPKSKADIADLARKYGMTPPEVRTIIKALDQASAVIGKVKLGIAGVQSKTVYLTTIHRDVRVGGGTGVAANPTLNADGGSVPKTGMHYADRHPYLLADGEEVISNRFGQADRHRGLLKAINAGRLADGGTAGRNLPGDPKARAEILRLLIEIRDLRKDLAATGKDKLTGLERQRKQADLAGTQKDLAEARRAPAEAAAAKRKAAAEKAAQIREERKGYREQFDLVGADGVKGIRENFKQLREDFKLGSKAFRGLQDRAEHLATSFVKNSKKLDDSKRDLETLRSDKASYASSVTSAFTHDPFGNGIAGYKLQKEADRNDAITALGNSQKLDGMGVDQGLQKELLASGDYNTLSQLASLSKADLGQYNTLYQQTAAATGALGQYAANDQFNAAIEKQSALVKEQSATLSKLGTAINNIERTVEAGTRKGAEAGTRAGMNDKAKETTHRRKAGK